MRKKVKEIKLEKTPTLKDGALEILLSHHWPGNVLELENLIERALIINPLGPLNFEILLHIEKASGSDATMGDDKKILSLQEVNTQHIENALGLAKGKINGPGGAAELLDIKPNTLRRRMDKLGIAYGKSVQKH